MVCGFLPEHLPASGSPVDCPAVVHIWAEDRLHAGAAGRGIAAAGGSVSVLTLVGERTGQRLRCPAQRLPGSDGIPGVLGRAALDDSVVTDLSAGGALLLRLVPDGGLAWVAERRGSYLGCRLGTPRHS